MRNNRLLPYETIVQATSGEPEAVGTVFGVKPLIFGSTYTYTYTLNAIPVFPVAVILIRRLFKKCNNPYIPGIMAGILLCWLQVSCSFTIHARVFYGPMAALLP